MGHPEGERADGGKRSGRHTQRRRRAWRPCPGGQLRHPGLRGRARRGGIHSAQRTARPAASAFLDLDLAEHGVRHDLRRHARGRGVRSRLLGGRARPRPRQRDRRNHPGDPVPARAQVRGAADGAEPAGVRLLGQRAARRAELGDGRHRLVRGEQRQRRLRAERADPLAAGALPAHHRGGAGRGGVLRLQPGARVRAVRLPGAHRDLPDRVRRHPEQGPPGRRLTTPSPARSC